MALERGNPIPPGVYWLDVIGKTQNDGFGKWHAKHSDKVTKIKRNVRGIHNVWWLIEVLEPVPRWPDEARLGLPTIAQQGKATSEKSTGKVPKTKSTTELLEDWGSGITKGLGQGLAVLVLLYLLTNRNRK